MYYVIFAVKIKKRVSAFISKLTLIFLFYIIPFFPSYFDPIGKYTISGLSTSTHPTLKSGVFFLIFFLVSINIKIFNRVDRATLKNGAKLIKTARSKIHARRHFIDKKWPTRRPHQTIFSSVSSSRCLSNSRTSKRRKMIGYTHVYVHT